VCSGTTFSHRGCVVCRQVHCLWILWGVSWTWCTPGLRTGNVQLCPSLLPFLDMMSLYEVWCFGFFGFCFQANVPRSGCLVSRGQGLVPFFEQVWFDSVCILFVSLGLLVWPRFAHNANTVTCMARDLSSRAKGCKIVRCILGFAPLM
jgi:hypothetical protein